MNQVAEFLKKLNSPYDLIELLDLRDTLNEGLERLGMSLNIPPVIVNPFELLVRRPELTKALGEPLGFPHFATSPEEGRALAKALEVAEPEHYFLERGCLYFGDSATLYRSSDSVMRLSNEGGFDPIETAWIQRQINCRLSPTN